MAERKNHALTLLIRLKEQSGHTHVSPVHIALVFATLGEEDEAFAWLEEAHKQRDPHLLNEMPWPDLDFFRSDPRVQVLLRKMDFS